MYTLGRRELMLQVVAVCLVVLGQAAGAAAQHDAKVRPAYLAGSWYPGEPAVLGKRIDVLLAAASSPTVSGKPVAIISPHAGYRYSAPVAAAGYGCLQGHAYKRVIVLAFSHRNAGTYHGVDVPDDLTAYQTPLGEVAIDRAVCDQLLKNAVFGSHPGIDRGEHSLELQLPFLQKVLEEFRLVPLLVGRMSTQEYAEAASAIIPWLDDETLLVASSDFTHFGARFGYTPFKTDVPKRLGELADHAAAPILECDFDGFLDHLERTGDTICGRGPITLLLRILSMHQGAVGVRAALDTSGQITGDWRSSVTYQSIVFTPRPGKLDQAQRDELLKLARQTVEANLKGEGLPQVDANKLPEALGADGACFVTLENHGRLRGCIGNMVARGPLYESVIRNAVSACSDRRFVRNPVTAAELDQLDIEISYLTPMKRVEKTDKIIVGRHGLLVSLGPRRGVLLPQVAARRGWTREEFLAQTCRKAGLPPDAWKQPDTEIYSFEAEVFGEPE
ncbi:MAG: AmmeMemoRadiSam system protein B [Phycisphaerae bacterium]